MPKKLQILEDGRGLISHRKVFFTYLTQFAGQAGFLNLVTGLKFESKNNSSDNSMRVCDGLSEKF